MIKVEWSVMSCKWRKDVSKIYSCMSTKTRRLLALDAAVVDGPGKKLTTVINVNRSFPPQCPYFTLLAIVIAAFTQHPSPDNCRDLY